MCIRKKKNYPEMFKKKSGKDKDEVFKCVYAGPGYFGLREDDAKEEEGEEENPEALDTAAEEKDFFDESNDDLSKETTERYIKDLQQKNEHPEMFMLAYAGPQYYPPVQPAVVFADDAPKKPIPPDSDTEKYCPMCGNPMPPDAPFCSECGYSFPKADQKE